MIVLPMAGLSQRFARAGYALPKYRLPLGNETVFTRVVRSFARYFATEDFLFICRDVMDTPDFVAAECEKMAIAKAKIVVLRDPTQGQAETVALGLEEAKLDAQRPVTIFNIDTLRPDFRFPPPEILSQISGFLEVFRAQGDSWSFAKTLSATDMTVTETAEKRRISDLCSTGLYYFSHAGDFLRAFAQARQKPQEHWEAKELYVAPLYNDLIREGKKIIAVEIPPHQLIPCGIPEEYEALRNFVGRN